MTHDKVSFAREMCKCKRLPYRIINPGREAGLSIQGIYICYSLYNHSYTEIVSMIETYANNHGREKF